MIPPLTQLLGRAPESREPSLSGSHVCPPEQIPAALWLPAVGSDGDSSSYTALTQGTATLHLDHPGGSDRHTSCPAVGPQLWSEWLQVTQDTALRRGRGAGGPRCGRGWCGLPGAAGAPQQATAACAPASRCGLLAPRTQLTQLRGARARRPTSAGRRARRRQDAASRGPHAN